MNYLLTISLFLCFTNVYSRPFVLVLPSANSDDMAEYLLQVSDPESLIYREYLTMEQVKAFTTPSDQVRQPVFDWLEKYPVDCVDNGDSIRCEGNITTIAQMFNMKVIKQTLSLTLSLKLSEFNSS